MLCVGQEAPRGTRGSPYGPALVEGPGSKDLERPLTGGDRRGNFGDRVEGELTRLRPVGTPLTRRSVKAPRKTAQR
jgi:hypothetical protein